MPIRLPKFRSLAGLGWREMRELGLRLVLQDGFQGRVSIDDLPHEAFQLDQASGLYDPARNSPLQQGTFRGFITGPAVLWPSTGAIADPSGRLVEESLLSPHFVDQVLGQRLLKKFSIQDIEAPYVTSIGHLHRNYYHRHIDCIPRVYGLHHPKLLALPSITLVLDPRFSEEEEDIIRQLLPDNVQIERVSYISRLKVERFIYLPYLSDKRHDQYAYPENCAGYLPQEYLNLYREKMTALWNLDEQPYGERIYISRAKAKIRRFLNEEEVQDFLKGYGFSVYEMEGMPIREQAQLFARASHIFTLHGAALTNLLYVNPQATVIEVFSRRSLPHYATLAKALGNPYVVVRCDGRDKNADVMFPVKKLRFAMKKAGL